MPDIPIDSISHKIATRPVNPSPSEQNKYRASARDY